MVMPGMNWSIGHRARPSRALDGHVCVEREERGRDVTGVDGVAEVASEDAVVEAVVARYCVADVASVPPAVVVVAKVPAPHLLGYVSRHRRLVGYLDGVPAYGPVESAVVCRDVGVGQDV